METALLTRDPRIRLALLLRALPEHPEHPERLIIPDIRFRLNEHSDAYCKVYFRFTKEEIRALVAALYFPDVIITRERSKCYSIEAMCIFLERLTYPNRWCDQELKYGRRYPGLSNIFYFVLFFVVNKCRTLLYFDGDRLAGRLPVFSSAVESKTGGIVRGVWGFIDGTAQAVCRPGGSTLRQRVVHSGHKRKHCKKFQTVVTPGGLIPHAFGPVEGRRYDLTVLRASKLEDTIQRDARFVGFVIYGDAAYGRNDIFASPFPVTGRTATQEHLNYIMSKVRIDVEWSYGEVVQHWAACDFSKKMMLGKVPVATVYKACIILTNCLTIFRGNNHSRYFGVDPP